MAGLVVTSGLLTAGAAPALAAAPGPARWIAIVTNRHPAGPGSLSAAISGADSRPPGAVTVIRFAVTGTIAQPAARSSAWLPLIIRPVIIDGTSAPGYHGSPAVAVDFRGGRGLSLGPGSAGSQVLGLALDRAGTGGISLLAGHVTINHDWIGLSLAGRAAGNLDGIDVFAASGGNRIGLNPSRRPGAVGNVISGNRGSGIVLAGSGGNTIAANRIGTDPAGTAAIGNGGDGMLLWGRARGNEIGGTAFTDPATGQANNPTGSKGTVTPVFVVPPLGNLVSGNHGAGIELAGRSGRNTLNGNFVGTTADGDAPLGNRGDGVWIHQSDGNRLAGCRFVNNPFVYYNVISGNRRDGLRITDSDGTVVQGNFFGISASNSSIVGNRRNGIQVDGTSAGTRVGGVIPLGNVAAGNGRNGIAVTGRAAAFTTFNTFGGLLAFKGAAPNGRNGLLITSPGRGSLVRTNVFSGNRRSGIVLAGHAAGVTVDPVIAGLSTSGRAVLPNGRNGLLITGHAHGNVIGGTFRSVIPQNTFSGNDGYGVAITGRAHGNRVFGTFAGPAILGLTALGNARGGVLVGGRAYGNVIGAFRGRFPSSLISGNHGPGVVLTRATRRNSVVRNYLGLDRRGRPLPNAGPAVIDAGAGNIVRGNRR